MISGMRDPRRVSNSNFSEALTMLPSKSDITVCCAHPAYQIHDAAARSADTAA
jgi:hypothetical protein